MRLISTIIALFTSGTAIEAGGNPVASPVHTLEVGKPVVFEARSPDGKHTVVFEDDGDTGYFYALNRPSGNENPIQEAMSIYDVKNVAEKTKPSQLVIVWLADSSQAALFINSHPHAVFDFKAHRGYCRTNFPKPGKWGKDFKWDDAAIAPFKKAP